MDVNAYLKRISHTEPVKPDAKTLYELHLAHMLAIPFENLDIGLKRPIHIDEQAIWNKIVINHRGGFCYELNGLFAWLLKQIGFAVTYLNARVYGQDGSLGIDFDHLALLVQIPGESERWLADVGFGDSFKEPLQFKVDIEQIQGLRGYWLEQVSAGYAVWRRNYDDTRERKYYFDLTSHNFPQEYEVACQYQQTSPESGFTRSSIISRATEDGRVSLQDGRLILTVDGLRKERSIPNKKEFDALLKKYFNIEL